MKKSILTLIIIAIVFAGCKKEENLRQPETTQVSNIEQRILNFEQKLQSGQKDGTTYAIDSAEWYVEALLNYNTVTEGIECAGITIDTAWTSLPIPATGEYTLTQLESVYSQLLSQVEQDVPQGSIVFAVDLYHYQVESMMVFSTNTAYATQVSPMFKSLNDTSGYWFWGGNAGMCGPDSGLYVGMDAADIFTNELNTTTTDFWTSLETHTVSPFYQSFNYYDPDFPFTTPGLDSSRIFRAFGDDPGLLFFCLSPSMMDYYLSDDGLGYIIDDLMPERKQFAYCNISHWAADLDQVLHNGTFTYGIPIH